jgi:hypothetical protein
MRTKFHRYDAAEAVKIRRRERIGFEVQAAAQRSGSLLLYFVLQWEEPVWYRLGIKDVQGEMM